MGCTPGWTFGTTSRNYTVDDEVPGFGLKQVNRLAEKPGVGTVAEEYLELEVTSGAVLGGLALVDGSADDAAYVPARGMIQ